MRYRCVSFLRKELAMSRPLLLLTSLAACGLASCGPVIEPAVSPRAAMRFDAELAGLSPGRPQHCLPPRSTANVVAARGRTLLFREGRMVYANETSGGCSVMADDPHLTLVTESFGSGLCSGSFAKVVDLQSQGMIRGVCALGEFTPYRRP
jgi:hypothetical protein